MSNIYTLLLEYDSQLQSEDELPLWALGDYTLVSCFKHEADHRVYLVKNRDMEPFILKVSSGFRQNLIQNEYLMLKQLDSPYFPKAIKCLTLQGKTYFLREYVPGQTLADYAEERHLTDMQVAELTLKLCDVVLYLHSSPIPIIHRDIKPQNLILTPDGRLVIIDMDSAQFHDNTKREDNVILGTKETAAPEQFGARRSDMRADIYGIGMVMLYLLCNDFDLDRLDPLPVSASLKGIIRRCTRFDPAARYQNICKLKTALKLHMRGRDLGRFLSGAAALLCGLSFIVWPGTLLPESIGNKALQDVLKTSDGSKQASSEDIAVFSSPVIEEAVIFQLGKRSGTITYADLRQIKTLYLCGDIPFRNRNEVSYYSDEAIYLNGELQTDRGTVTSLEDLKMMPNLEHLLLYLNDISDISPLEDLPLKTLALSGNPISDFSPIAKLTKLQYLELCCTLFEDASLMKDMSHLRVLSLNDTYVRDIAPLKDLPLEEISLSTSNIIDDPEVLNYFINLKKLRIHEIRAEMIEPLGKMTNLRALDISRYPYEDLSKLSALNNLEELHIEDSSLVTLEGIEAFPYLRSLNIAHNNITDLSPLYSLKYLRSIKLNGVPVEDYTQLNDIPSLMRVYVYPNEKIHFPIPDQKFTVLN